MSSARNQIEITLPDDWHSHLRDGVLTPLALADSVRQFGRVCAMPNLSPPVVTVDAAVLYQARLRAALPSVFDLGFTVYHSLYLTETTALAEVERAADHPLVLGFKWYPAGATTHSDAGVKDIERCYPLLAAMEKQGLVLQIHGEVVDAEVDMFDREAVFIERVLLPLKRRFPALRLVLEHISTAQAVDFVESMDRTVAATITPQHLLFNRNAIVVGGLRPHYYCLPILKRETHRLKVLAAATSGNPQFFLGTDSAPHNRTSKEAACGCAGCYTALHALPLYAQAFDQAQALSRLEGFASFFGADFYGLPRNSRKIRLQRAAWQVPSSHGQGPAELVPLAAGSTLNWQLAS